MSSVKARNVIPWKTGWLLGIPMDYDNPQYIVQYNPHHNESTWVWVTLQIF